ncbi:MAG: hypothetical protein F4Z96_02150 [Chloroflexi bacterium]|nr:hypothetical protein [Chloroflexota bacterium]
MQFRTHLSGPGALLVLVAALALVVLAGRDSALPSAAQATDQLTGEITPAGCGTLAAQQTIDTSTPTTGTAWTFPRDAYVRVVATANAGCAFVRFELILGGSVLWTTTTNPFQFQLFSGVTTTVRAHFSGTPTSTPTPTPTPQNHTLTTSADANGSVDPAAGDHTYASGTSVTVTATPATGYRVASWGGDCSGDELTCELTMDADKTASVTFELDQYTLTTSVGENGAIAPAAGTQSYAKGTSVTVTATPDEGYRVAAWGGDCSGGELTCQLTMDANKTASVTFELDTGTFTLTTSAGTNGSIEPDPGVHTYARGTAVTVRARPNNGYGVASWGGDCSGSRPTCTLVMSANRTASVTFARTSHILTTSVIGEGDVSPGGTTTHAVNTMVTLTASWNATTHSFAGWGGDCSGAATTCTVTMSADRVVTARFTALCENGTAVPNPTANSSLVADCQVLLRLRDVIAGTATLNWSSAAALTSWTGVTVGGTPQRVTRLSLPRQGLTGQISGLLGNLTELTHLELQGNALTGRIPSKLGQLVKLTHLYLRGSTFTGCIPSALWDATNHDIASLGLTTCPEPTDVSSGAHTLGSGTYKFILRAGQAPLIFDVPGGARLKIVGIVISDSGAGGPSFMGLILENAAASAWICLDVEKSEECGRRVVTGTQGQAGPQGQAGAATGPNISTAFDRIAESLWMDDTP